ncbi:hypothetical protein [Gymnodinialimonas sp.]
MSFAADIRAALPPALHLPDAIARTMDWLEVQGHRGTFTHGGEPFLGLYPPDLRDAPGASFVLFHYEAGPPFHEPPNEVTARVASIAIIAGDGGTLALWADAADRQHIVVFNHGIPHVLTSDPLVALQFLAIGYSEPGALTDPTLTAEEQAAQDMAEPPLLPQAYRAFLESTFNVALPSRASDLGISIPPDTAPDPIRDWLDQMMPEPDPTTIPGMTAENPYIMTAELREALGDEGVAILRESYPHVIEEE